MNREVLIYWKDGLWYFTVKYGERVAVTGCATTRERCEQMANLE